MLKSAVDIGTNSIRLLIMDTAKMRRVFKRVDITRLGEGVGKGLLQPEPMVRTANKIALYVDEAKEYGTIPEAFATSAVRDAENRTEFCNMVKQRAGIDVEVIDGDTEAKLDFTGATALFSKEVPKLVIDIGGGSTEFIKGGETVNNKFSLNMGSVRFTERFVSAGDLAGLYKETENMLGPHLSDIIGTGEIIGIGGTITGLAAIDIGLEEYDASKIQGYFLGAGNIKKMRQWFSMASSEEIRSLKGMQKGREDIILAGTAILEKSLDMLNAGGIYVSDWDSLEGYLIEAD